MTSTGRMIERYRRLNFGRMEVELTVDDSKAYTKPWTVKFEHRIDADAQLIEGFCENERDQIHMAK